MRNPLKGEASLSVEGEDLLLVIDNNALVMAEGVTGESFVASVAHLVDCEEDGLAPKLGTLRAFLWAALRSEHPELDLATCGDIVLRQRVDATAAIVTALVGAMPKEPAQGEAAAPVETPADTIGGTGTTRSRGGRKRANA